MAFHPWKLTLSVMAFVITNMTFTIFLKFEIPQMFDSIMCYKFNSAIPAGIHNMLLPSGVLSNYMMVSVCVHHAGQEKACMVNFGYLCTKHNWIKKV